MSPCRRHTAYQVPSCPQCKRDFAASVFRRVPTFRIEDLDGKRGTLRHEQDGDCAVLVFQEDRSGALYVLAEEPAR